MQPAGGCCRDALRSKHSSATNRKKNARRKFDAQHPALPLPQRHTARESLSSIHSSAISHSRISPIAASAHAHTPPHLAMHKYEQHEKLGQGTSAVYRAIRLADGEDVALKRVVGWAALAPPDQATALREVAALKAIDHPHAIQLLDSFTDRGDLCLVFPLLAPGARVFEDGALPLSPAAVARAGYQLASALAYLHGQAPPLLHRDVKPANLLLAAAPGAALPPPGALTPAAASALVCRGTLVLSDFGSALAMRRAQATGTVSGTPAYKAGEILREDEYAAPADVWALGATLLQLATGHVAGGTSAARKAIMGLGAAQWTLQQALAGAYHDKFADAGAEAAWGAACGAQRAAWGALGEELRSAIGACLALQPESRASAGALLAHAAFEREAAGVGVRGGDGEMLRAAAGAPPPGAASAQWDCAVCTFVNGAEAERCGVCEVGVRASAPPRQAALELPHAQMAPARVVELMRLGARDARAAEAGARALREISREGPAAIDVCVAAGAVPAVTAALQAHPGAAGVAQYGCRALAVFAQRASGLDACVASGAALAVAAALKTHEGVADVAKYGCGAVMRIAVSATGLYACVSSGAVVPAVVAALKASARDASVAEYGCKALAVIAESAPGSAACVASGAAPAVVAALICHVGVDAVAKYGCKALSYIAASTHAHDACMASVAVRAVLAAIKAHPGMADVAQYGCRALAYIALSAPGEDACVTSGAVPAVVASLTAHECVAAVALNGCWALMQIAVSAPGQDACASAGAVPAVVAALRAHPGDAEVAHYGCWALMNIATSAPGQDACLAFDAVPAVVAALQAHEGVAAVAHYGCWALTNFAIGAPGQAACVTFGAVPAVVGALTAHAGVEPVALSSCWALLNMGWSFPSNRAAIVAAGAIPLIAAACAAHPGAARQKAREALDKLGYTDTGTLK
jgi:serine/threonine protein kinase